MALSKHLKRSSLTQKIFELHAWVKKCHFGNFSERAGMALPCQCGPQKCIIAFEKFVLFWLSMNIQEDWRAKLEIAYSFILKYHQITVCMHKLLPQIFLSLLIFDGLTAVHILWRSNTDIPLDDLDLFPQNLIRFLVEFHTL